MDPKLRKSLPRTPRGYDGTAITSRSVGQLLSVVLEQVSAVYSDRPDLIVAAWSEIIGPKFAPMARAVRFYEGLLHVKVSNSTLHSLLCRDQPRIVRLLKERFPSVVIQGVVFRIG